MTTREYFQTVLDAHLSDDMDAASLKLIASLDARNEKRKSADSKQKKEAADRRSTVLGFLKANEGEFTRDSIAEATGLTPAQVSAACRSLGDFIKKNEVKIDKTKRVVYSVAE